MSKKLRSTPLSDAIAGAGSLKAIADPCGVTEQAVCQWAQVPARHVLTVERVSGVPRQRLRPDLYPANERVIAA
jgi:DNA-binding transcriptional regulator YdaS (Cro superfamily)